MTSGQRQYRSNEDLVRGILTKQQGLITIAQARECGVNDQAVSRRVRAGELERVLPGVYRSVLIGPTRVQSIFAAVLWAGRDSVASHTSAADIWRIDAGGSQQPEIWVPTERRVRSHDLIVHRGTLAAVDRRMRDGIPVTSPARTLVDLAGRLGAEDLEAAVEDVLHRGLTTPAMIERRLDALGGKGRAGVGRLRDVLRQRDGAALESRLEVKLWAILRTFVPRPVRQYQVRIESRKYRLDFAWPRLNVAVEADGYSAHGTRRAFVRDRRRLADLVAAGWTIIPVTWDDCVDAPDALVQRIHAVMRRAA